ncbi:hypothetical protein BDV93DRAFT_521432 [Ceratobasidium sp. AG-I]|nr:hypothetical protein BDV93DRAFT_521432 [Ceratobasidium sp. AG-I]
MVNTSLKHVVFIAGPSWGHLRPGFKFVVRMVEMFPDAFISLFVHSSQTERASEYLDTQTTNVKNRVRIVHSLASSGSSAIQAANPFEVILDMEQKFGPWITAELQAGPLQINGFAVASPSWIIENHINGGISLASKRGHRLPVVSWWVGPAASLIRHIGNSEHGSGGRLLERIASILEEGGLADGVTLEELYQKELSDQLVCIPGLPAHYEHEQIPQLIPFLLPFVGRMMPRWNNMMEQVDHVVFCATYEMDPITAEISSRAFSKPVTPLFVGPAVDPPADITTTGNNSSSSEVTEFLDRAYRECGAHSVVYIAFGTAFFPLSQSIGHLSILLEEVVAQGFRFVFSLSSAAAKSSGLRVEYIEQLVREGKAIFPSWTNQTEVLDHQAVHYFVSHGGWNSAIEAIPFAGDQPTNALQVATQNDCGFELIQIRTGPAKNIAYQPHTDAVVSGTDEAVREEIRRILQLSRSPKGRQQRRNIKALGTVVLKSLAKDGSGSKDMQRLGKLVGFSTV